MELLVSVTSSGGDEHSESRRFPLQLSGAKEASVRCMLPLVSLHTLGLQASLFDADGDQVGDSGAVALNDDDWMCLNSDKSNRLISLCRDTVEGWTFCFDVDEHYDGISVLKYVRVVFSKPSQISSVKESESFETALEGIAEDTHHTVLDCADFDGSGLHPTHSTLLKMLHQPKEHLLSVSLWSAIARGGLSATPGMSFSPGSKGLQSDVGKQLSGSGAGHAKLQTTLPCPSQALAETMDALREHGFPPVFIFMYDQVWMLVATLFGTMADVLESSTVEMSLNVFAWALQSGATDGTVGGNFGHPHRDQSYKDCHDADGQLTMATVWLPLVPVTLDNGCMYVVPADRDPLLEQGNDPRHFTPDAKEAFSAGEALPCDAGDLLTWRADLIHWGSACSAKALQPRKSVGILFMRAGLGKSNMMSEQELRSGLSLEMRLRIILRTLLRYRAWYPEFMGLSLDE